LTLGLIDVDFFKLVNDRHGHAAGDRVLATLGRLLGARFRAHDLKGRWGGEEFALAFPGEEIEVAGALVQRVLDEFASVPFRILGAPPFRVTFSAGLARHPGDGGTVQTLLERADRRLYAAKQAGRARVVGTE